jgi:hypothetical protein
MTHGEPAEPGAEPLEPGGDPVCWLHLVCESCGALLEREGDPHRPGCGAAPPRLPP